MLWTVVLIAALIIIKWTLIHQVPKYQHLSLFDFDLNGKKYLAFNFLLYGLHSPIQEFVARGVLQGSLQHFFIGKNITLRAIVVSNALFSATHVHLLNGMLGVIVFIPGLFWGWLYSRQQNLIGVSLSHIMIGWSTLFFLNIESLF
jgi:membrane protease YdiL (CAAX protease family)